MKVAIVGVARPLAFPWLVDDPAVRIWAINGPVLPKRVDLLFQLHGLEHIRERHGDSYVDDLAAMTVPIYMPRVETAIPTSKRYPIELARELFGDYFTGSFPYAIALAILAGDVDHLFLDGMNMRADAVERWALPCIEHALGYARARGVHVIVDPSSGVFDGGRFGPRYGYEGADSK